MEVKSDEMIKLIEQIFLYCRMSILGTVFSGEVFNTGNLSQNQIDTIDLITDNHVKKIENLIAEEVRKYEI
ncbi:hypothetical protein ABPH35_05680 [Streptococcus sp. ZJ93]|uniref:hypothetical protein n=1 Tax=Streptococcus handemini TaxID=3161188 RepID=UPI0032EC0316